VHRYILGRLVQMLVLLFAISIVVFILARATGSPLELLLPLDATQEDFEHLRKELELDRPYPVQYWAFISRAARGDFGNSVRSGEPALQLVMERAPASAKLAGLSLGMAFMASIPLGVLAAARRRSYLDSIATIVAVMGQSVPSFWIAIILIQIFAVSLGLLPVQGIGGWWHYLMPGAVLGGFTVAAMTRLLRSAMIESLGANYVTMARGKGVPEWRVIWKHAFKNALIPVSTFAGITFATIFTAAVVTETVFAWPGVGRLAYEAIKARDYPVIQAVVMFASAVVVLVNLLVDIAYSYIDPRIRYS